MSVGTRGSFFLSSYGASRMKVRVAVERGSENSLLCIYSLVSYMNFLYVGILVFRVSCVDYFGFSCEEEAAVAALFG